MKRSPQNPAVHVATLQLPPFSSPTVYQTGTSVSKWEEMEKGGSFFRHIYSFSFEGHQIWRLNGTHICSLKSEKKQYLASHSCQIHGIIFCIYCTLQFNVIYADFSLETGRTFSKNSWLKPKRTPAAEATLQHYLLFHGCSIMFFLRSVLKQ